MLTYVAVDQISTCVAHTLKFFTTTTPIFWMARSHRITWRANRHLRQKWPSSRSGLSLTFFRGPFNIHRSCPLSPIIDWLFVVTTDLGSSGFLWQTNQQGKHFPSKYDLHHYMGEIETRRVFEAVVSRQTWYVADRLQNCCVSDCHRIGRGAQHFCRLVLRQNRMDHWRRLVRNKLGRIQIECSQRLVVRF